MSTINFTSPEDELSTYQDENSHRDTTVEEVALLKKTKIAEYQLQKNEEKKEERERFFTDMKERDANYAFFQLAPKRQTKYCQFLDVVEQRFGDRDMVLNPYTVQCPFCLEKFTEGHFSSQALSSLWRHLKRKHKDPKSKTAVEELQARQKIHILPFTRTMEALSATVSQLYKIGKRGGDSITPHPDPPAGRV